MKNCQRILVVIIHYFDPNGDGTLGSLRNDFDGRAEALGRSITSIHDLFNNHSISPDFRSTYIPRSANADLRYKVDIKVLTTNGMTVLDHLAIEPNLFEEVVVDVDPTMLGFEANEIFKKYENNYDRYVFLEDDIILHDPLFFVKLDWFEKTFGSQALLQPHLYEVTERDGRGKVYIDGDFVPDQVARYRKISDESPKIIETEQLGQQFRFCHAPNPHSGCYFISQAQLHFWLQQPWYLDRDTGFVRSFESAASLGILKTFDIYKPDLNCAAFLEVQHFGSEILSQMLPSSEDALNDNTLLGKTKPKELRLAELEAEVKDLRNELQEYKITPILLKNAQLEGEIKQLDGIIRYKTRQLEAIIRQQSTNSQQAQQEIQYLENSKSVFLENAQLEGQIKYLHGIILHKTVHSEQLETITYQQKLNIQHLETTITKIYNSMSWHLTKPLRYLKQKFKFYLNKK